MESCFYSGTIRHRRFEPVRHEFTYRLMLVYVDLAEIDAVFSARGLWSTRWPAIARFRRDDHLGSTGLPLDGEVRATVEAQAGFRPAGPIRLLTSFRCLGFEMNPISLFYCFDAAGLRLEAVVAEVNNTPWGEQHCYVLDLRGAGEAGTARKTANTQHAKEFHVSPFLEMDMDYAWQIGVPNERLSIHVENRTTHRKPFDATLTMQRTPINGRSRVAMLLRYPFMTQRVFAGIYWQAFRLWMKGVPYVPHPKSEPKFHRRESTRRVSADSMTSEIRHE